MFYSGNIIDQKWLTGSYDLQQGEIGMFGM